MQEAFVVCSEYQSINHVRNKGRDIEWYWENDETREIRWEELRWKRSETKADEPNRNYSVILATLQITSYVHSRNSS